MSDFERREQIGIGAQMDAGFHPECLTCPDCAAKLGDYLTKFQEAIDGLHFHHKQYEPLCTHCRAAKEERST